MSPPTIVGPGTVVGSFDARPTVIAGGGVAFEGDRVIGVGAFDGLCSAHARADLVDARDGLILPGLVNLHHHFYSALARGLDPGRPTPDFKAILEGLWWRLDRALDADTVRLSAALSLADCVRCGCTTVFDHHASPAALTGSLELMAEVVADAGLSAALCYEITDRNGPDEALAGLEENLTFASAHAEDRRLRGLLGLHASFTVADRTLSEASRRRPEGLGIHIHLAEDGVDAALSLERHGARPLERLEKFGLVDSNALLVHGIHLRDSEYRRIADTGATLIHNPESNANNGVGRLDLQAAGGTGCAIGLGTDGMSSDVLASLRAAFLAIRNGAGDPAAGFEVVPSLLGVNARRAATTFDEPLLGRLEPGAPADLIVVDPPPPTPVDGDNAFGHLVYGASLGVVRHTIARGRLLLRDFRHQTLDVAAIFAEARAATPALWERFRNLPPA